MNTKIKNIVTACLLGTFILSFSVWAWVKPADEYSFTERKNLKQFPEITWSSIVNKDFMKNFETYTLEQFPLRDGFANIKAGFNLYVLNMQNNLRGDNNYYIHNGYVCEMEYPMNQNKLDYGTSLFNRIYKQFLSNRVNNVYFSIVPDKNYFIAEESGQLAMDYEKFVEYMKEKTDYMEYIDIFPLLSIEDYYKTDTHWRQEMIVDVADKLATSMGTQIGTDHKQNTLDRPFAGVYYGQSAIPGLKKEPLIYLTNDMIDSCKVYTLNPYNGRKEEMPMYDIDDEAHNKDLYGIYLSGTIGYIEIVNPNAKTNKELVLFRDSFGSSIAPLLAEGYSKVTIIDIRQMPSTELFKYVRFNKNQDVLFLYSTLVLNNSTELK